MGWFGASGVPAEAVDGLELASGERPLASATTADGSFVVATDTRLFVPARGVGHRAIVWERIATATWDDGVLSVRETGGSDGPGRTHVVRLEDEGSLPETVRERVQASIVISEHVDLVGAKGARISGRRSPGDSEVQWTVTFDSGLDPRDPDLRAAADAAVTRFKQMVL